MKESLKLKKILVLGVGSNFGSKYKLDVFKKLRKYSDEIYVCELKNNDLIQDLLESNLIEHFLPIDNIEPLESTAEYIIDLLGRNCDEVSIDAVVTYREEWLKLRTIIASKLDLPHPSLDASINSQDKYKTRQLLNHAGLQSISFRLIDNLDNLANSQSLNFPFF